jgi:hypothetical protein
MASLRRGAAYSWLMPPSTISSVPTIKAASGDDR